MVKIRLRRDGAKKAPYYKVVVADSRYPRDGRFIEEIGSYDPMQEPAAVNIDTEKYEQWIKNELGIPLQGTHIPTYCLHGRI